ncbi:MBL fold metallo-hydrolase [Microbispora sp. NBC_01189]|uniref:MBL fold metallo-hydrolase n=1 Tax=Microbispora sp. NBC_01189 TaxID=2903583 RepID=UPI002E138911|nr:MBL fold metallo-hydrolase [Microbispora sp. NBC_01189]
MDLYRRAPRTGLRYLGHAGFIAEHQGVRLLMDPWFYPAFLHSWFPYPDNRHVLDVVTSGRFDYLYVSHAHEDHYDERLLRMLDRSITVIVPRYRSRIMVKRFAALGFDDVVALGHKESHELAPGFTVTMYLDTSHKEDSGLLLDLDGYRFLDLNDCNTPMSELPGDVDLLAAQYSGAMWYPNCYDYPPEVMGKKVEAVRGDLLDTLYRKVRITGAAAYLPSAGPACFLDPVLEAYNDREATIFPRWEDVADQFAEACPGVDVLRLFPGDVVRLGDEPGGPLVERDSDTPPADDLAGYRERRRDEWGAFYDEPAEPVTTEEIEAYFAKLQSWNRRFLGDFAKDVRLVADGRMWDVRLGRLAERFVIEGEEPYDPEYTLLLCPRTMRAVIEERTGWEEALLSMRVGLHREPDVFDLTFMSLLRYGNQPVQTMQMLRERQNTETIERDGLRMQRFCPHAGEDLTHAVICDGVVECPRHHWKWDATTGECIDGGTLPLRVEPLT